MRRFTAGGLTAELPGDMSARPGSTTGVRLLQRPRRKTWFIGRLGFRI